MSLFPQGDFMAEKNNAKKKRVSTSVVVPSKVRKDRVFVLDTNVLLHDPKSIYTFKNVVIVIPFIVLEELDKFKKDSGDRGHNAREIIRTLDALRKKGHLGVGVPLDGDSNGSLLKIVQTPSEIEFVSGIQDVHDVKDNAIIQTTLDLVKEQKNVTLVTKDINVRIKADSLGINVEDYLKGTILYDSVYKGWMTIPVSAQDLKTISDRKLEIYFKSNPLAEPLNPNQFVVFENENNPESYKLFRHFGGQFKEVGPITLMNSFGAKNIQQLMALDLLLDDNVQLLSLLGPAGTGKTFLALLVGLFKIMQVHAYRRLLVTRPVIALGADIGFLPGDIQEKLHFWMQPVHDNLDFIFNQMHHNEPTKEQNILYEKRKGKKVSRHHMPDGHASEEQSRSIDNLIKKGILSLEAITYMRGRSIPNQFVFVDEVQNLTPHEVKTLVSRAGAGTKVVLAGDPSQIDSPYLDFSSNGLTVTTEKMKTYPLFGTVFLEISERSELAKLAAEVL